MSKTRDNLQEYIKDSSLKSKKNRKQYTFHGKIHFYIIDALPKDFDALFVIKQLERTIPYHLCKGLDIVYVGQNSEFSERYLDSMYKDGAIYVTNEQPHEEAMIDDIVHEIAHCVEENYTEEVYGNKMIEREFIGKRTTLKNILTQQRIDTSSFDFNDVEYSKDFDMFLYKYVGYELMVSLTMGLFTNPYAPTSLREYFATGFSEYYTGDRNYLNNICLALYKVLDKLDSAAA